MEDISPLNGADPSTVANFGFLLVGHGTRRRSGQEQFRQLFKQFQAQMAPAKTELAFLELAEPDIPSAIQRLKERGAEAIVTVPVLLFSAGHALRDIPNAVREAAKAHCLRMVAQTPAFESAPQILELSALRFREAVCQDSMTAFLDLKESARQPQPAPRASFSSEPIPISISSSADRAMPHCSQCSRNFCKQVALTLVGRGSSSPSATEKMRSFTRDRCRKTLVSWAQTAFIHAQQPDVPTALNRLQLAPGLLKVVQPHLLFEGELVEQLRTQVAERQRQDPTNKWVITDVLGADDQLSKTLANMAKQVISAEPSDACGV